VWESKVRAEEARGWQRQGTADNFQRVIKTFNMSASETVAAWAVNGVISYYHTGQYETPISFMVTLSIFDLPSTELELVPIYHFGTTKGGSVRYPWRQTYYNELMKTETSLDLKKRQRLFDDSRLYVDRGVEQLRALAHTWAKATVGAGQR
jgi:hypothetical protein